MMDFIDSITPVNERVDSKTPDEKEFSGHWRCRVLNEGRIYFVNVEKKSSQWLPPPELWNSKFGLPYGWEVGIDDRNLRYYICHVNRTTTREDPRSEADQATHFPSMIQPKARKVEIVRDEIIGYGFVAGSEKPVVIRSVVPNGPSHELLFANDQILKVNGQDVRDVPQNDVINLIKSCIGPLNMEVIATEELQDVKNKHQRKSSLMSRTTRERRKSSPVSVRFAEEPSLVHYIGPEEEMRRSSVPLMPNVLKVFLENGQTRSFRYTNDTLVEEILASLTEKLAIKVTENFGLILGGPFRGQISYINTQEKVCEIYSSRNLSSVSWLCRLQICFVPKEPYELLKKDPNAFEYLYAQISNNVVDGLYGVDLRFETAIKLAALHIQQVATEDADGKMVKISLKNMDKDYGGMQRFLPGGILNHSKEKKLKKVISQQVKQNLTLAAPGQKHMNSLQCKWHYLNIASDIFSYGGKYFNVLLVNSEEKQDDFEKQLKHEATILIGPKRGISHVVNAKVHVFCELAKFEQMTNIVVANSSEGKRQISVGLIEEKEVTIISSALDCVDIIALITGYYRLYIGKTLAVQGDGYFHIPTDVLGTPNEEAPAYEASHRVLPDSWSYPFYFMSDDEQQLKKLLSIADSFFQKPGNGKFRMDFSKDPPTADIDSSLDEHSNSYDIVVLSERARQYLVNHSLRRANSKEDDSVFDGDGKDGVDIDKLVSPTLSQTSSLFEIPEEDDWTNARGKLSANKENDARNGNRNSIFSLLMAEHQWMNKIMGNHEENNTSLVEEKNMKGSDDGSRLAERRAKLHLDIPYSVSSFSNHAGDIDLDVESKIKRSGTLSRYLMPSSQDGPVTPESYSVEQDLTDTQSISSASESVNSSEIRDDMVKDRIGAGQLRSTAEDSASTWSWSSDEQEGDEVFVIHQDELPREDDSMLPEIFLQPSMSFSRYSHNLSSLAVPHPSVVGSMMSLAQFETYPQETAPTTNIEKQIDRQNINCLDEKERKEDRDSNVDSNTPQPVSLDVEPDITIEQIRRLRDRKRLASNESASTSRTSRSESSADESYVELMLGEARLAQIQRRRKTEEDENLSNVCDAEGNNIKVINSEQSTRQEKIDNDTNIQRLHKSLTTNSNDQIDLTRNGVATNFQNGTESIPGGAVKTDDASDSAFDSYLASRFSPSQWVVPQPPGETESLEELHVTSPPPSEFQETKFFNASLPKLENIYSETERSLVHSSLSKFQHPKEMVSDTVELEHSIEDKEIEELIVPPPPFVTDPLLRVIIASPPSAFLDELNTPEKCENSSSSETVDHSCPGLDLTREGAISRELHRIETLSVREKASHDSDGGKDNKTFPQENENGSHKHRKLFCTDYGSDRQCTSVSPTTSESEEVFLGLSSPDLRLRKSKPLPPERRSSLGFPKAGDTCMMDDLDEYAYSTLDNGSPSKAEEVSEDSITSGMQRCRDLANIAVTSSSEMKNRLEKCISNSNKMDRNNSPHGDSEIQDDWHLSMQNHARFLACDVKVICTEITRNTEEIAPALETSLASLSKLVSSFEIGYKSWNPNLKHNINLLVSITVEIVTLYSDVVVFTKAIIETALENPYKELLANKAEALVNHLASLIAELKTIDPKDFSEI